MFIPDLNEGRRHPQDESSHKEHLKLVLHVLREKQLFVNKQYTFGQRPLKYCRHLISVKGFSPDPKKRKDINSWHTPMDVKEFLGLTGDCRSLVKSYGKNCLASHIAI